MKLITTLLIVFAVIFAILLVIGSIFLLIGLYNISQEERLRDEEIKRCEGKHNEKD